MKKIIPLGFLILILFSLNCYAMYPDQEFCDHFEKLSLSPTLRLHLSPDASPNKPPFIPATSWQDESLMDLFDQNPLSSQNSQERKIKETAELVDGFLQEHQEQQPRDKHPFYTRGQTFYIPRSIN